MEMVEGLDEISGSVEEVDRKDADTSAAPGRFRNSCASSPPCEQEEDGHARVEEEGGEMPAQGRSRWSWASQSEGV